MIKPNVFVIAPFAEEFTELYSAIKEQFKDSYEVHRADDLDSEGSIIKDIVLGIKNADVIIADLTGLNANVFYELGIAHGLQKKTIIITQTINELPFDIKSYKTFEYSPLHYKIHLLYETLSRLIQGAITNTCDFGNPVTDYAFSKEPASIQHISAHREESNQEGEKGFLDYISDVQNSSLKLVNELQQMVEDMTNLQTAAESSSEEINRVKSQSRQLDVNFARNICRKLATHLDATSPKLSDHIVSIQRNWNIIEESYLYLLDSEFINSSENLQGVKGVCEQFKYLKNVLDESKIQIETLKSSFYSTLGIERKLTRAANAMIVGLDSYLTMTDTIHSSIDRMINKSQLLLKSNPF